jgi:DNA invertase Pin-like site-specific DNA recombinase
MNKEECRVWTLLVVSSDQQADTIEYQRDWTIEKAKQEGWKIAATYEGIATGKYGLRPKVLELVRDLKVLEKADRPKYLVMIRLDRVGRGDAIDTQLFVRDLSELGVRIWTRDSGEVLADTAMQQMIVAVKASVSAYENEVRLDKIHATIRRKKAANMPLGNRRPYGLRLHKGYDVPIEPHAQLVSKAFALRAAGHNPAAIGRYLQETAPKEILRNDRTHENRWTSARVSLLLRNHAYVDAGVIDEATYTIVRERMLSARRSRKHAKGVFRLGTALTCSCGYAVNGHQSRCRRRTKSYRYYRCNAPWNHGNKWKMFRADPVEQCFVNLLAAIRVDPSQLEAFSKRARSESTETLKATKRQYEAELATLEKNRLRIWELHESGKLDDDILQDRQRDLTNRRREIESRLVGITNEITKVEVLESRIVDIKALVEDTYGLYIDPDVTEDEQRRVTQLIADEFGLCFEDDGTLSLRRVDGPYAQRSRDRLG